MDYPRFDLDGLKALDALLRERHVTRAATLMHMSQPAMSRVLARLRREFDDELLVRSEAGLGLTARAQSLVEPVRRLLADASALTHPVDFNPRQFASEICIAGLDVEQRLYLPALLARLAEEAPGISLRFLPFSRGDFGILDSGEADFLMTAVESSGESYRRRLLYTNTHVVVMSRRMAARFGDELTIDDYLAAEHGLISPEGRGEGLVDRVLREKGLTRRVSVHLPSFLLVPELCAARDLIFTPPERITRTFTETDQLKEFRPPFNLQPTETCLYWHPRNHASAVHKWFRELIYEVTLTVAADNVEVDEA